MRSAWFAVLCAVSVVGRADSQSPTRQEPLGTRFLRGERLPAPFGLSLVAATADGFVAVTVDDRLAGRLDLGREPFSSSEFFYPDDVLKWTAGINSLIAWVRAGTDSSTRPVFVLGGANGLAVQARGVVDNGQRTIRFDLKRCYNYVPEDGGDPMDPGTLLSIAGQFRRAAIRANAVGLREPPDDAIWYGHAVTCPATPDWGNTAPPWPLSVKEFRPRQEVMQFVVDATGRVEQGSARFLPSSDPRFTASITSVLSSWRFTPARRMGRTVRQLVHLNVGFTPPIVLDRSGTGCPESNKSVIARVAPGTQPRIRPDTLFLRSVAQALAADRIAIEMQGTSIRFGYDRFGGISNLRILPPERALAIDEVTRQIVFSTLGGVPALSAAFQNDTVDVEVEFAPRCEVMFTAVGSDLVSMLPQGDGMIRIANMSEADRRHLVREREHTTITLPAGVLRQFVDTIARLMPAIDTTGPVANGPDYAPDTPMLGAEYDLGLNMWLSRTGWIRAGFWCGRDGAGQARFIEVQPSVFAAFRRVALAAVERLSLQPAWVPRGDTPYLEHELTCHPVRVGHLQVPMLPRVPERTSMETVALITIDESGRVEPGSAELMPGLDTTTRALLLQSMRQWTFQPGVVGNSRVRTRTHINLIIHAEEADAVVLASLTREMTAEDTVNRTIFYKPPPQPRYVAPLIMPNALQRTMTLLQPHIDRARESWPAVRNRFIIGMPLASDVVVTTMIEDNLGNSTFAFIRVDRVVNGFIHGRVWSNITIASEYLRGDLFVMPETALIDWRIIRSDGTLEGNFLGKFLESRVR